MTRILDVNPIKAHLDLFVKAICQRQRLKLDGGITEEVEKFSETIYGFRDSGSRSAWARARRKNKRRET
jgi:hypothetical protein